MDHGEVRIALERGGEVSLRPVAPGDEEFLLAVYASTREEELAQVEWPEGQKELFLRSQCDAQRTEYEGRFPDAEYDVISVDGRPAGRLWVGRTADEIRLLDIALLPEFRNRGVGEALLRRLTAEAARTGLPLRHMVFILNTGAKRFYERLGFEVFEDHGAYLHMEWRRRAADAPPTA
jgi:ribosomal protein S18 acetylase RimI-like enzyme